MMDWFRDMMAIVKPWGHPGLGPVHPGMYLGMTQVWSEIKAVIRPGEKVVLNGHSLGAARACTLAGLMVLDGMPPVARVGFGCPKPGFQTLADLTAKVQAFSYKHVTAAHHDLVTDVPFTIPPEDYVHASVPMLLFSAAPGFDPWGSFRLHHMELYAEVAPPDVVV